MDEQTLESLDAHLPASLRELLENRLWQPIGAGATLEALSRDPLFLEDPGHHPAMFADHGVAHVRDVAAGVLRLLDTVDGVLLAARPTARRAFLGDYGVAIAYLHDIGMADLSRPGRRTHALYAAHAAFGAQVDPLVEHLVHGPVGARAEAVVEASHDGASVELVVREMLALAVAHSKSAVPSEVLDDHASLRRLVRGILATSMREHRERAGAGVATSPLMATDELLRVVEHPEAFGWLEAVDGPSAELTDDVLDAVRLLRAADVLRQRGSTLRTSGGFEVFFDARTALAVCALRPADGSMTHLVTYDDRRGAGEANIRAAFVTPGGDLRVAVHRGLFPDADAGARAVESMADAVMDIQSDVLPAFAGRPARGLPAPTRAGKGMRIEVERPTEAPAFADSVVEALVRADPRLEGRALAVADVEWADAAERSRYHHATAVDPAAEEVRAALVGMPAAGVTTGDGYPGAGLDEVRRAHVGDGEVLVSAGSPPAFVYVPLGDGLIVRPDGGYGAAPLPPFVPVGTTGVVRRSERNAEIVAAAGVDVLVVPAGRYLDSWWKPLTTADLPALLSRTGSLR